MQFKSKTDDEIQRESLIPAGVYDFQVISAQDKKSKTSGADMIALELSIYVGDKERVCKDWLMESMAFKLRHFCYAVGLGSKYEDGSLTAADCNGRAGKVRLVVKESEQYGPQNNVKDYVVPDADAKEPAMTPATATKAAAAPVDDGIPFACDRLSWN